MKRENWVFDNWYDYDLIFDETGELRHPIVDGEIEFNYYYEGMASSKESNWESRLTTLKSKIRVNYDKLIDGNQKYIDLGIKPGDTAKILVHTRYLNMPRTEEWIVTTPVTGYYPTAVIIRHPENYMKTLSVLPEWINAINYRDLYGDGGAKFFGIYFSEDKYQECLDFHKQKIHDSKINDALNAMQSLSKEDQQKIINKL